MKRGILLIGLAVILTNGLIAMPPVGGGPEPANIIQAKETLGIDNPKDGLIHQTPDAKISGTRSYPVVMGYFTDRAATYTQTNFQSMLFSTASGVKSVTNYYKDMSYNTMTCTGTVGPWVTSGNTVAYFGGGNNGLNNGTTKNVYEFIRKVIQNSDASINFANPAYDLNNDGYVDVLWVVHAGKGGEEVSTKDEIWSHSFQLTGFTGGTAYTTNDYNSTLGTYVKIDKYIIMPELTNYADGNSSTTEMIGCGVFCHEFGHALGLPDLYDTGGYSISGQGLGYFSLMAGGSWGGNGMTNATPVSLDVWSKRFLGWASPTNITSNGSRTVASILNTQSNSSYRLAKGGSTSETQYWLIENRYTGATGPVSGVAWDAYLPGSGLAVYHIDETYAGYSTTYFSQNKVNVNSTTGSSRNRPYGVALEETDMTTAGYSGSELYTGANGGEAVDLFNSSTQASFDSIGTNFPISYKNDGSTKSGVSITGISAAGANMTATFNISPGSTATPTLAVSITSWSVAASGGTSSAVSVTNSGTTSVIAYTVSSNQTWLSVSATSGNTPGSFTMTASANTSTSTRTATVTVTATTSGVSGSPKTITVTQAGASGQNDAGTGGDAGNDFATATLVSPGSWTGCYLDGTDRNDYYKFNVTSGQVIKVKITPPSSADYDLYLYNPSQTQKASSTRGTGYVDSVVYTADASGYWYARAYQYSGSGNYSLLISVTGGSSGTWTTVSNTVQSAHPYANNYNYTWTITGPTSATKMKVYFDSIKTETNYDTVFVLNSAGTVIQKWHGTYRAIWSNEVSGNVIKIRLKTDASVTAYGFLSTKYQYYTATGISPVVVEEGTERLDNELLYQNHPNPVVNMTRFTFNIPDERPVELKVYNVTGQLVRTLVFGTQSAGRHTVEWDLKDEFGKKVAAGTYLYRIQAGDLSATRKLQVLR